MQALTLSASEKQQAAYWEKVSKRTGAVFSSSAGTPVEISYRCLCCCDSGTITPENLMRYAVAEPHSDRIARADRKILFPHLLPADYDTRTDAPVLCKNCTSIMAEIETPDGVKSLPRLPLDSIFNDFAVGDCRLIHEQEVKRRQAQAVELKQVEALQKQAAAAMAALSANSRPPSAAEAAKDSNSPATFDEQRLAERLGLGFQDVQVA